MAAATPPSSSPSGFRHRGALLRVLGVGFGLAVTVGNTVGAGILRTPGEVATQLPVPWLFLAVWVAGGLYALLGAATVSELGAMMPRSGGYYVFARRAFGDFPAFVVGWTDWLGQSGTIAATAILFGEYAGDLWPPLAGRQVATATACAVGLGLAQARGVRWGGNLQNVATALKGIGFFALMLGFVLMAPAITPASGAATVSVPGGAALAVALLVALQSVIYTYDGWYGVIYFGEEVRQPARDVPRSMIGGVLLVMAIYLPLNAALLHLLSPAQLAGQSLAVGTAAQVAFGVHGDFTVRAVAVISLVSAINAYHMMTSRIPLAMARDGLLPGAFAQVNPGGTPILGLALSTAAAVAFIWTGSFREVTAVMAFFFVANYVMAYLAVFVLRRREPQAPRPFRAWGHPASTGLALLLSLGFLIGAVAGDTANSLRALLVLAASYPVYRCVRWTRKPHAAHAGTDPR
jgi:APA family basic amino acid/polyamine antiporter